MLFVGTYGNVMGYVRSALWKGESGVLPLQVLTRFNISLADGVEMVLWSLEHSLGGGFCAKIPSYRITDVAEAIGPSCEKPIIGTRPGEKIHEEMITESDSFTTVDLGDYYAILPADGRVQRRYAEAGISCVRTVSLITLGRTQSSSAWSSLVNS